MHATVDRADTNVTAESIRLDLAHAAHFVPKGRRDADADHCVTWARGPAQNST